MSKEELITVPAAKLEGRIFDWAVADALDLQPRWNYLMQDNVTLRGAWYLVGEKAAAVPDFSQAERLSQLVGACAGRGGFSLSLEDCGRWVAQAPGAEGWGSNPPVAVGRCLVTLVKGPEVSVPRGLCERHHFNVMSSSGPSL